MQMYFNYKTDANQNLNSNLDLFYNESYAYMRVCNIIVVFLRSTTNFYVITNVKGYTFIIY